VGGPPKIPIEPETVTAGRDNDPARELRRGAMALNNPNCCQEATDDFLARHMHGADGQAGARALASLRELTNETRRR